MTDSSDSNGHSEFRESKNGSPTSETGSEEAPRAEAKYVGEDKAAPRKVRRTTPSHTRHKKRKVKTRLKKPAGTSSAAFSENLQQLREVFVSFCKPANVMNPDFDMKAVASDPLQLDTIKMNSANFAKFSRDCCMVSVTGEDVSLSRTDVDIIFARQMAKASDRRNISWLQFLECLAPMAEKLDFSFEEFCSAVVQQSRQQLVMRNAVAQRKVQSPTNLAIHIASRAHGPRHAYHSLPVLALMPLALVNCSGNSRSRGQCPLLWRESHLLTLRTYTYFSGTKTSRVARGKSKKYINKARWMRTRSSLRELTRPPSPDFTT